MAPESVPGETSELLLANESIPLAQNQKAALQAHRDFSQAIKTYEGVSEEVMHGTEGHKIGLMTYQSQIISALAKGDIPRAQKAQAQLATFAEQRSAKADAFLTAQQNATGRVDVEGFYTLDGKQSYVTPNSKLPAALAREAATGA